MAQHAQKANMPARNKVAGGFKLGSGMHGSQLAKPRSLGSKTHAGKQNLPTKNSATKGVPLGTTKHAPGTVPAYLKRAK